jgi:hypothetical protein
VPKPNKPDFHPYPKKDSPQQPYKPRVHENKVKEIKDLLKNASNPKYILHCYYMRIKRGMMENMPPTKMR